jgi:hypothetical protein
MGNGSLADRPTIVPRAYSLYIDAGFLDYFYFKMGRHAASATLLVWWLVSRWVISRRT